MTVLSLQLTDVEGEMSAGRLSGHGVSTGEYTAY